MERAPASANSLFPSWNGNGPYLRRSDCSRVGRSLILTAPWIRWVAGLAFLVAGASYLGLVGGSKTCSVPLAIPDDSVGVEGVREKAPDATTGSSFAVR